MRTLAGDPKNGFQTMSCVLHTIFRMVAPRTFALSAPNHLLENQAGQVGGTLQRLMRPAPF
jgi:hypothetical protein